MHKYLHHIGDFMRDTAHLTSMEECFYRRALDYYYLNESPLPKETCQVFRRLRAVTEEEKTAVQNVLADFFYEADDGFHNKRCDHEIANYKVNAHKSKENGKKGGRPPKNPDNKNPEETSQVFVGFESETQNNLNQEPLTVNQKPLTTNQEEHNTSLSEQVPPSNVPHMKIVEAYNSILGSQGLVTVNPNLWAGSTREAHLRARWKEAENRQSIEWWAGFFNHIANSDFLMGRVSGGSGKPFRADFGWILKKENFIKICEGKYHG